MVASWMWDKGHCPDFQCGGLGELRDPRTSEPTRERLEGKWQGWRLGFPECGLADHRSHRWWMALRSTAPRSAAR